MRFTDAVDPALISSGVADATVSMLVSLGSQIRLFDPGSADEDAAVEMVRSVEAGIRRLQGFQTVVAGRLAELAAAGSGVSVEDAFAVAGKLSDRGARKAAKRARLLEDLPLLGASAVAGTALTENLDAVATARHRLRHDPGWVRSFDARDATIASKAVAYRPAKFAKWITGVTDAISDAGGTDATVERDANRVRTWQGGDGRVHASVNLDTETGARFLHALDAQTKSLAARRKLAGETFHLDDHHRALAFDELFTGVNAGYGRANINLVIDEATLTKGPHPGTQAYTSNGFHPSLPTIRRYLCDATITPVTLTSGGLPLNVGRTRRTASHAQRAALATIYPTCAWCDVPIDHCQIHHITFWENGGTTDIQGLIPLCSRHHHQVHEGNWSIRLDADRNLHIIRPNSQTWAIKPPPSAEWVTHRTHHSRTHRNDRPPDYANGSAHPRDNKPRPTN